MGDPSLCADNEATVHLQSSLQCPKSLDSCHSESFMSLDANVLRLSNTILLSPSQSFLQTVVVNVLSTFSVSIRNRYSLRKTGRLKTKCYLISAQVASAPATFSREVKLIAHSDRWRGFTGFST